MCPLQHTSDAFNNCINGKALVNCKLFTARNIFSLPKYGWVLSDVMACVNALPYSFRSERVTLPEKPAISCARVHCVCVCGCCLTVYFIQFITHARLYFRHICIPHWTRLFLFRFDVIVFWGFCFWRSPETNMFSWLFKLYPIYIIIIYIWVSRQFRRLAERTSLRDKI